MNFLANTWILWLILTVLAMIGMGMYRQNRRAVTNVFTSAEDFSARTILLSVRRGEGDLFFGYIVAMISCSLFVAGFMRWVRQMF